MLGLGTLILGAALAVSGTKALIQDIDCKSTPYRKTRDGKPVSVTLKGDDYILYIKGLDNEKLLYELIKQAVVFNGLAQKEQVTDDDIFRYNMVVNEVYGRMEQ